MHVGLVACCKTKLGEKTSARFLYNSQLFKLASAHAELTCDRWFILSALHGVVHPDREIEPYDMMLADKDADYRYHWGEIAARQLLKYNLPTNVTFRLYAGNVYFKAIKDHLFLVGPSSDPLIVRPLQGLGIGQQLQWLKSRCKELIFTSPPSPLDELIPR